jgi:hypothetical protein
MSLTQGTTFASRIVTGVWSAVYRTKASLVGGCRPIPLASFLDGQRWATEYHSVVTRFGVPSEVVVATPW